MKQNLLLVLILIVTSCGRNTKTNQSLAQASEPILEKNNIKKEILNKVESSMQENNIPALSLGLIRDSKIYFTSGFGTLNRNSTDSTKSNSIFQIASLSKMLTGILTRSLENENIIDINKPIIHYLSDKISKETQSKLKDVKIEHLLFHTSGFPHDMKSTFSDPKNVENKYLVTPYRKDNRQIETSVWKTGKLTPASGIYSNVEDLSNLMTSQISAYGKNKDEDLILNKEKANRGNENSYYGYGIFIDKTERGILYGHRGDMDGFASEYTFNPERNVGVIILTSSGGRWAGLLAAQIMKILEENSNSK